MTLPASITLTQTATGPLFVLADGSTQPALTPSYAAWLTGLAPAASDAQLASGSLTFLIVQPAATRTDGTAVPAKAFTAGMEQIVKAAVPQAAEQALAAAAGVPPVTISTATPLTVATHGGMTLVLQPGASISLDWAATGNGFGCLIINRTGTPIVPVLSGFSNPIPVNGLGEIAIPSPGAASLYALTPDGGTTTECWLIGDTVS